MLKTKEQEMTSLTPHWVEQPDDSLWIYVPRATPSGNRYAYSHWRVRHKDKSEWMVLLRLALSGLPDRWRIHKGKRRLFIRRYGQRKIDIDNGYAGLKGIIDNMRKIELIQDDDPDSLELTFENGKLEKGFTPYTVFILENA